jgi:hypothetical protein
MISAVMRRVDSGVPHSEILQLEIADDLFSKSNDPDRML